jgi:hypothetical protein
VVDDFRVSEEKPIQSSLPRRRLCEKPNDAETLVLRALDASADALFLGMIKRAKASSTCDPDARDEGGSTARPRNFSQK